MIAIERCSINYKLELQIIWGGENLLSWIAFKRERSNWLLTLLTVTTLASSLLPVYASIATAKAATQIIPVAEDPTPGYWETSEFMIGSIAVSIVFLESNGTIDPDTEDWTSDEESEVIQQIPFGLYNWAVYNGMPRNVSFVFDNKTIHYRVPTSYEPISRNYTDEVLWISEAMNYLGYAKGDHWTQVYDYVNDLRDILNTDWAFVMFIVDNSNDLDGCFEDGWSEYAWPGGPYLVMTYTVGGWGIRKMGVVCAHEVGHIFHATDEYNGITEYSGYLNASDIEGSGDLMDTAETWTLSSGAMEQVGWRDSDGDGIQDIVDTFPRIYLNPPETSQGRVNYTGTTVVTPIVNKNPYTNNPNGTRNVTINKIQSVEFRVDSGNWTPATSTDGNFGDAVENFALITEQLNPGNHTIEVKSTNQWGNSGHANTTVTIPEFLETDLNMDGKVNIQDIFIVAKAYQTKPGDENWDPRADLDGNDLINIVDLYEVAKDYGKTV